MQNILSYGGGDPNVVVLDGETLYRRIPTTADPRWAGLSGFVRSDRFRKLMQDGLVVKHNQDPVYIDECQHFEGEYIRHFSNFRSWTFKQKLAALDLICRLNLELSSSEWQASDCHIENTTYRYYEPIYCDIGSFSTQDRNDIINAFKWYCNDKIGLILKAESWVGLRDEIALINTANYNPTEWSHYDNDAEPNATSDIKCESNEHKLVIGWAKECGARTITDAGCNRGRWSKIMAVELGIPVLAVDLDEKSVDACWQSARNLKLPITSLLSDLFAYKNQLPKSDMVVFSSILHHWCRHAPGWAKIYSTMSSLSERYIAVEWIDGSDFHVAQWKDLQREDYNLDSFVAAMSPSWAVKYVENPESNSRTWLLLERKDSK